MRWSTSWRSRCCCSVSRRASTPRCASSNAGRAMADSGRISLRGVSKLFPGHDGHPDVHALGPVDLDIAAGEFVSVVGPSGCGKSTLLDVLSGLSTATAGTATFDGKPLIGGVPDGIGAVFQ